MYIYIYIRIYIYIYIYIYRRGGSATGRSSGLIGLLSVFFRFSIYPNMYRCIYIYIYTYTHMYIYRERERDAYQYVIFELSNITYLNTSAELLHLSPGKRLNTVVSSTGRSILGPDATPCAVLRLAIHIYIYIYI